MRLTKDRIAVGIEHSEEYAEQQMTSMHMPEVEQTALLKEVRGECAETAGEAFGILVSHYHSYAVRLADYYLQDSYGAEDIVQDVWVRMWGKRETLKEGGRFWMFVKQCVMNAVRNSVRNAKVRQTELMDMTTASQDDDATAAGAQPSWEPSHGETPEKLALQAELRDAVQKTLESMKPAQADLLRRVEFDGVSVKAYAAELGVKYPTMKRRAMAARAAMKEAFITDFPELAGMFAAESA